MVPRFKPGIWLTPGTSSHPDASRTAHPVFLGVQDQKIKRYVVFHKVGLILLCFKFKRRLTSMAYPPTRADGKRIAGLGGV